MGSFADYLPWVLGLLAISIVGLLIFVIIPKISERWYRQMGGLSRKEMLHEIKSTNRIKNWLKTMSLYGSGGGIFFLGLIILFIVTLEEGPIPNIIIKTFSMIGGGLGIFLVLYLLRLINAMNTRKGLKHTIAITTDGGNVVEIEPLYDPDKLRAIGTYSKQERIDYLSSLNLQFCPHHAEWTGNPNESMDWEKFCMEHCNGGDKQGPPQFCSFYRIYQELIEQSKWRLYEVEVEYFGPFEKAIYILPGSWNDCFPEQRMQYAVRNVLLPWKAGVGFFHLVDINRTGRMKKGTPERILAPILLGTQTALERKQIFQNIAPQGMENASLEAMLLYRPYAEADKIFKYVRTVRDQNISLMQKLVNFIDLSAQKALNIVRNLLGIGKEYDPLTRKKWLWAIGICAIIGFIVLALYLIFRTPPTKETTTNTTRGLMQWLN